MTCSDHTTLDGGALRCAPLRLLDLESLCSGRSDQSDWLYQVRPKSQIIEHFHFDIESRQKCQSRATLVFDDICLFLNPDFKDECTRSKDE